MHCYDLVVIGMGAAFQALDAGLDLGLDCAVAERGPYGGTCLNHGCIPSKVIITVADEIRAIERSASIGLTVSKPRVDFSVLKQRVVERTSLNEHIQDVYQAITNLTTYEDVCFVGEKILAPRYADGTTGQPFTANTIIIGAGGHVTVPHLEGIDSIDYMTPVRFFADGFPAGPVDDVVILGGGAIGCEFAHFFAATGSVVTILQRNVCLAPILDRELSHALKEGLERDGVRVETRVDIVQVEKTKDNRILVTWQDRKTKQSHVKTTDMVFLATGISSNAPDIGAHKTGLSLDHNNYIRTNEYLETTVPGIYAIGDINGLAQFRHKANYEIETLTYNLFHKKDDQPRRQVQYRAVPACIFSHPQLASVGMTEEQAIEAGLSVKISRMALADVVKGYALGLSDVPADGFVKMIVDAKTDKIVGVHIAGHEAALLVQPFAHLMQAGTSPRVVHNVDIASDQTKKDRLTYDTMTIEPLSVELIHRSVVIHPALSEAAAWVIEDLKPADEYEPRR